MMERGEDNEGPVLRKNIGGSLSGPAAELDFKFPIILVMADGVILISFRRVFEVDGSRDGKEGRILLTLVKTDLK